MIVFVDPEVGHLVIDPYHEHPCLVCGKKTARTHYRTHEDWRYVCYDCVLSEMGYILRDESGALVRPDGKRVPVTIVEDEKQVVEPRAPARVYTGAMATLTANEIRIGGFYQPDPPTGTTT